MDGTAFWVAAVIASIAVGLSKGGLPVVAMMSVPILSLAMPPLQAAGLLLPIYIVSDWFGVWAYRREYDLRVLKIMFPATAIGIGLGWATASLISEHMVGGVIGALGSSFAASRLLGWGATSGATEPRVVPGVFWGTAAGFTSFVSHAGGPPYQIYTLPLRLPKAVFAGTSTIAFTYVNAIKLIPYYMLGQVNLASLEKVLVLMPVAALSVFAGVALVKRLPEALFFRLVTWALLVVSAKLIWDGLHG